MDDITHPRSNDNEPSVGIAPGKNSSTAQQRTEDDTISLADYFHVIAKHRRVIFWICAVAVITTTIISSLLPKSYAATSSVVPPVDVLQKGVDFAGSLGAVKSPLLNKMMDFSSIADMYVGILQSRSVADALIERFDLRKVYRKKKYISDVREELADRTSVKVTDEGIITITVEDGEPRRAAALANAYVEELDRRNKLLFVGQAASKKVFLENRLKEIQAELSNIENIPSREARIKEMLFELLTKEYELAKIEEAKSIPTIQVLDGAVVPEKKSKPKRTQMILLAGVVSLFGSVFIAITREYYARMPLKEM
jgi:uncharacterized protein involved in exopolysaccharide biosynthesis